MSFDHARVFDEGHQFQNVICFWNPTLLEPVTDALTRDTQPSSETAARAGSFGFPLNQANDLRNGIQIHCADCVTVGGYSQSVFPYNFFQRVALSLLNELRET